MVTKCRCSEIIPGDPNTRYGKLLTRLTLQRKAREMAIIRASCGWRDPAAAGGVCHLGAKTWGRPGPSLRLSLPGRHLVNSVAGALAPPSPLRLFSVWRGAARVRGGRAWQSLLHKGSLPRRRSIQPGAAGDVGRSGGGPALGVAAMKIRATSGARARVARRWPRPDSATDCGSPEGYAGRTGSPRQRDMPGSRRRATPMFGHGRD